MGYAATDSYKRFGSDIVELPLNDLIQNNFTNFDYIISSTLDKNSGYDFYLLACVSYQKEFIDIVNQKELKTIDLIQKIKQNVTDDTLIICTTKSSKYFIDCCTYSSECLDNYIFNSLIYRKVDINLIEYLNIILSINKDRKVILACTDLAFIKEYLDHPNIIECADIHS